MERDTEFCAVARRLKSQSDITIRELADICYTSESTMSRYLSGRVVPPPDVAQRVIQALRSARYEDDPDTDGSSDDARLFFARLESVYEQRISGIRAAIEYERRQKRAYHAVMMIVLCLIVGVMTLDVLIGTIGWFRH